MPLAWVVDDDDEMRHAIKLILELIEYEVVTYRDARSAARDLVQGNTPDVMILDIMMPQITGIDMLEFMQRHRNLDQVPVVMLSSETTDVQVDEAMEMGADAFVFKPVTIEELEAAIKKAISKH